MLEDLDVSLYCGVDQSETALSKAEVNLASLDIPCRLYPDDLLVTLRTLTGRFDVIVASFSLHHLETAEAKKLGTDDTEYPVMRRPSGQCWRIWTSVCTAV